MSFAKNKIILIFSFLICALFTVYNSVYTVPEGYMALLSPSSSKKTNHSFSLQGPGLHFKIPFFIQSIPIDTRLQSFSFKNSTLLTADKYPLVIDYYVKWHVTDPALYYLKTGNDTQQIHQRLTQEINTLLQVEYTHNTLNDIINSKQASILNTLLTQTNIQSKALGITLIDIGFKSIDFPSEASTNLLKNMRTQQARIALEQLAIGKANAENIRIKADNQASLLLAKAKEEAAIIRSQGDATAAKIYSDAYLKNPQFAAFYLNLEAYRQGFTQSAANNNFLVLNTRDGFSSTKKGVSSTHSQG